MNDDEIQTTDAPLVEFERLQKESERQAGLIGALRLEEAALQRDLRSLAEKHFPRMLQGESPRPYFLELRDFLLRGAATYAAISERANEFAALFRQMEQASGKLLASDECRSPKIGLPPAAP